MASAVRFVDGMRRMIDPLSTSFGSVNLEDFPPLHHDASKSPKDSSSKASASTAPAPESSLTTSKESSSTVDGSKPSWSSLFSSLEVKL